jgi:hypothetical protein
MFVRQSKSGRRYAVIESYRSPVSPHPKQRQLATFDSRAEAEQYISLHNQTRRRPQSFDLDRARELALRVVKELHHRDRATIGMELLTALGIDSLT